MEFKKLNIAVTEKHHNKMKTDYSITLRTDYAAERTILEALAKAISEGATHFEFNTTLDGQQQFTARRDLSALIA
jgi:hypothetical protein